MPITSETASSTVLRSSLRRHLAGSTEYGTWWNLARARDVIPGSLLTLKPRRVPFGVCGRRLVAAIGTPAKFHTMQQLAEAVPSRKLWTLSDNMPITWMGFVNLRRDGVYLGRLYIPSKWTQIAEVGSNAYELTTTLWTLPPGWSIIETEVIPTLK